MSQVEIRAASDDRAGRVEVPLPDGVGLPIDEIEERRVLQARDLHRLAEAAPPVPVREAEQHPLVADHRDRHVEAADEVLLAEAVDTVLHADRGVELGEHGRGEPHEAHASVGGRGGEAHRVEHRTAAEGGDVGTTVDAASVDGGQDPVDDLRIVLRRLPAGDDHRLPELGHPGAGERGGDSIRQAGIGVGESRVHDRDESRGRFGVVSEDLAEHVASRVERIVSEDQPVPEGDREVVGELEMVVVRGHGRVGGRKTVQHTFHDRWIRRSGNSDSAQGGTTTEGRPSWSLVRTTKVRTVGSIG